MKKLDHGELPFLRLTKRKIAIRTSLLTEQHIKEIEAQAEYIASTRASQAVYFIRAESGPIKIGIAIDPRERLGNLQTCHFEELRLVGAVPGGIGLETALHRKFNHLNIRGEWFRPGPDLLAEIEALSAGAERQ